MPFDYKKEYKDLYLPPRTPTIVEVPPLRFVAVRGQGDPNERGGAYQQAMELLYGVAFTIKMAPRAGHDIDGYFSYVVPPLEGFWWMDGGEPGVDYARKDAFCWLSCIRLPDFVDHATFDWAIHEATRKKKRDFSPVEYLVIDEGLCVQCLHVGPYDDEPTTIREMDAFASHQGYVIDLSDERRHHEIYLSDARRIAPERLRTVVRHPIRQA